MCDTFSQASTSADVWLGLHNALASYGAQLHSKVMAKSKDLGIEADESGPQYITRAEEIFNKYRKFVPTTWDPTRVLAVCCDGSR